MLAYSAVVNSPADGVWQSSGGGGGGGDAGETAGTGSPSFDEPLQRPVKHGDADADTEADTEADTGQLGITSGFPSLLASLSASKLSMDADSNADTDGSAECSDRIGWRDANGKTCATMAELQLCAGGGPGPEWEEGWEWDWGTGGFDAREACCVCGFAGLGRLAAAAADGGDGRSGGDSEWRGGGGGVAPESYSEVYGEPPSETLRDQQLWNPHAGAALSKCTLVLRSSLALPARIDGERRYIMCDESIARGGVPCVVRPGVYPRHRASAVLSQVRTLWPQ